MEHEQQSAFEILSESRTAALGFVTRLTVEAAKQDRLAKCMPSGSFHRKSMEQASIIARNKAQGAQSVLEILGIVPEKPNNS
jgi:hypothetical protein